MTLTKDSESGVYKARINTRFGRRTISTGEKNKDKAKSVVKEAKVEELETADKIARLQSTTISQITAGEKVTLTRAIELWTEWLTNTGSAPGTRSVYNLMATQFAREQDLENVAPHSLTEAHVNKFVNPPASNAIKATTRKARRSALLNLFGFMSAKGWTHSNPAKLVKLNYTGLTLEQKETKQKRPFTDAQVEMLLKETMECRELFDADILEKGDEATFHGIGYRTIKSRLIVGKSVKQLRARFPKFRARRMAPTFLYFAIAIARWAGLRLGDIAQLEWDSFQQPGHLLVWTDKRDRRVFIPIHPRLQRILGQIPPRGRSRYCFPHERETVMQPKKKAAMSGLFKYKLRALATTDPDMPTHSFHDLRHTFITEMAQRGVPVPHISKLAGHADTRTTEGYIHR